MDGREFLQCSHPPKPQHRPLRSPERQVQVLSPDVEPTADLSVITTA